MDPLEFPDGPAWTTWLAEHHEVESEAWLRIGKKNAVSGLIAIGDALDEALCFGWIDAQRRGLDEISFLQRYCRRADRRPDNRVAGRGLRLYAGPMMIERTYVRGR